MKIFLKLLFFIITYNSFSQVGIGTTTPASSAALEISSTSKGFLPPRMSLSQINSISSPVEGLFVYNTDSNCFQFYNGVAWSDCIGQVPPNKLNCSSISVNGTSIINTPLNSTNTITIDVIVNSFDTYTINTNTVNGYSYSATGAFSTLGINTITLIGTGTPVIDQTDTFTIDFVGTGFSCNTTNTVIPQPLASCLEYFNNGFTTDGIYSIDVDGAGTKNAFDCYCDMTNDGGGWTLVFNHNVSGGFWANDAEADSNNVNTPGLTTDKYSILNEIDNLKSATDYEFRLHYPNSNKTNHWKQTFDPRSGSSSIRPVQGYVPISIDMTGENWGGLEKSGGQTFLDGSVNSGNWWYSIGSVIPFSGGLPGGGAVETKVQLYIR
tara:strand:- start:376 stop:1515 length:1140 start_codon:yes stop_codon:yes gene_type:complete